MKWLRLLVLLFLAGCGGARNDAVRPTASTGAQASGEQLFRNHCASCHGSEGRGASTGPSLLGICQKITVADFQRLLQTGRRNMPSFPSFSGEAVQGKALWEHLCRLTQ